ncbi:hypothetical protein [Ketobacter sp.]|uniref:hypothetical protein n=1 Tax=Ketobacter sp. TaxID=2083498 RepID=UPI0025BFFC96|nr:hypothetical protein [Ketobacter sp.]
MRTLILCCFLVPALLLSSEVRSEASTDKSNKLSILVDKVLIASTGWNVEPWIIDDVVDAGFNAYIPRRLVASNNESIPEEQLKKLSILCQKKGIKTYYWMRGTIKTNKNKNTYTPGNFTEQLLSPNSNEYWNKLTSDITQAAKLSLTHPALEGVFLDFEDYEPRHINATAFHYSYEDEIVQSFSTQHTSLLGRKNSLIRKQWLSRSENIKLKESFIRFQHESWQQRMTLLRKTVDSINPKFQFLVYPFNPSRNKSAPFIVGNGDLGLPAPIAHLGTEAAPIIYAETRSYSRPLSPIHGANSIISTVKDNTLESVTSAKRESPLALTLGGLNPLADRDKELGRNHEPFYIPNAAIAMSEIADGYWVFYEGLNFQDSLNKKYLSSFAWANSQIRQRRWQAAYTPINGAYDWSSYFSKLPAWSLPAPEHQPTTSPTKVRKNARSKRIWLRGDAIFIFPSSESELIEFTVSSRKLGNRNTTPAVCELRLRDDPDKVVHHFQLSDKPMEFFSQKTNTESDLILTCASGQRSVSVDSSTGPYGIYAGKPVRFYQNQEPLHLAVTTSTSDIVLTIKGSGREQAKFTLQNAYGVDISQHSTYMSKGSHATIWRNKLQNHSQSGLWKVIPAPLDSLPFEDYSIKIEAGVIPIFYVLP